MSNKDYVYLAIILILIGAGLFGGIKSNRKYKRNIKALNEANELKADSINALKASVRERDKQDSVLIQRIKDLDITTVNASSNTIINMPPDSFVLFITQHINRAGAVTN